MHILLKYRNRFLFKFYNNHAYFDFQSKAVFWFKSVVVATFLFEIWTYFLKQSFSYYLDKKHFKYIGIPNALLSSLLCNEIVIGFIRRRKKNSERKNTQLKKHAVVNYARNRRLFIGLMRYFSHCLGKSCSVSIRYNTIISCNFGTVIQSWLKKNILSLSSLDRPTIPLLVLYLKIFSNLD